MGRRYESASLKLGDLKVCALSDAIGLLTETASAKFDETAEMAVRLGVDPRHSDQMVRGTVKLPHGTGRQVKVLVFSKGEAEKEAKDAGAEYVGGEEFIEKIQKGWLEFDKVVAQPDMMGMVSRLGKILGPRGLMPNPKSGTVTFEVGRAVSEIKQGKIEFKVDKSGNVHVPFGKVSFGQDKLRENFDVIMKRIVKARPSTSKGTYIKGVTVSAAMGPGIKIDPAEIRNTFR